MNVLPVKWSPQAWRWKKGKQGWIQDAAAAKRGWGRGRGCPVGSFKFFRKESSEVNPFLCVLVLFVVVVVVVI